MIGRSLIFCMTIFIASVAGSRPNSPETVNNVDLNRYMGTWYELAAIPVKFQKDCSSNVVAEYSFLNSGDIKVINTCEKDDGNKISSEGRARVNPQFNKTGKLQVTFFRAGNWIWPLAGDYWITYLDATYEIAIVAHPKYKYGWILSRYKTLSKTIYGGLRDILADRGYDPCRFNLTKNSQQNVPVELSLCDYLLP